MSKQRRASRPRPAQSRSDNRRRNWLPLMGAAALIVLAAFGAVLFVRADRGSGQHSEAPGSHGAAQTAPVSLPAASIAVAGVEALQPVADVGRVALNTPVRREWRLRNIGQTTVTLNRPTIEVLEGC